MLSYQSTDKNPYLQVSYYRLKQTDFNGKFSYFKIKSVNSENSEESNVIIYQNPTKNQVTITGNLIELKEIKIYNTLGQDVTSQAEITGNNKSLLIINLLNLNAGIYYIKTKNTSNKVHKQYATFSIPIFRYKTF